jgi:Gpi18-like mannosyltransferase
MNRSSLKTVIVALGVLLGAAFLLPIIFNLVLGTIWLVIRWIFLLVLLYLIVQWFRGRQP